jgi:hypothetical protein
MKTTKTSLLLHPLFLTSLFLLVTNDLYWKYEYGNWLTGKLSDFAGLVVLPVFLSALFPRYRKAAVVGSGLFFVWWKMPLSEPVILFLNGMQIPVQRVVDGWDLLALAVLPVSWMIKPFGYRMNAVLRTASCWMVSVVSVMALCATSTRYMQTSYSPVNVNTSTRLGKVTDIDGAFRKKGIRIMRDTGRYEQTYSRELFVRSRDSTGEIMVPAVTPSMEVYEYVKPFDNGYVIPELVVMGDTLREVRIAKIGNRLHILSFLPADSMLKTSSVIRENIRRKYDRPLKKRIREILE